MIKSIVTAAGKKLIKEINVLKKELSTAKTKKAKTTINNEIEDKSKKLVQSVDATRVPVNGVSILKTDAKAINAARADIRKAEKGKEFLAAMDKKYNIKGNRVTKGDTTTSKKPISREEAIRKANADANRLKEDELVRRFPTKRGKAKFPGDISQVRKQRQGRTTLDAAQSAALKRGEGVVKVDGKSKTVKLKKTRTQKLVDNIKNIPGKVKNIVTKNPNASATTTAKKLNTTEQFKVVKNKQLKAIRSQVVPILGKRKLQKAVYEQLVKSAKNTTDLNRIIAMAKNDPVYMKVVKQNKSFLRRLLIPSGKKVLGGLGAAGLAYEILAPSTLASGELTKNQLEQRNQKVKKIKTSTNKKVTTSATKKAPIVKLSDISKAGIKGGTASQRLTAFMNMYKYDPEKGRYVKRNRNLTSRVAGVNEMMAKAKRG